MMTDENLSLSPKQAQQQLRTAMKRMATRRLPSGWPRFIDYAWVTFEPGTVIDLLMSEEPSYDGHKEILFAGLCTCVVCPQNRDDIRQHSMLLAGIEQIRRAEELGRRAAVESNAMIADMIGRMSTIGPDFYSDFYHPVGGISQVVRSISLTKFRRTVHQQSREIPTVVAMMQIFDFHAKHLASDKRYNGASLGKGVELQDTVHRAAGKPGGINRTDADDRLKILCDSAALSYAASTICLDGQRNLLDAIRLGEASYGHHGHILKQWLARARYATDAILRGLHSKPSFAEANAAYLPSISPEPTPEPPFSAAEQDVITAAFDIKRLLNGRSRTERVARLARKLS